jgi:glutamate--cysteine ligase
MPTIETKAKLEQFLCHNWNTVNKLLDEWQADLPQPIYSSVDVRESGNKYAPVDHNLYPAGFNNICQKDLKKASEMFRAALTRQVPGAKRVALIPESHTKNKWYLDNVHHLATTLRDGGLEVDVVSPDATLFTEGATLRLESQSGHEVVLHQVEVREGVFRRTDGGTDDFDVVLLNNDQSNPLPVQWRALRTPVLPSPYAGWTRRQKNEHFKHYAAVANAFCAHFGIRPDLIQARFLSVEGVDFETKEGVDKLADSVGALLAELPAGSTVFAKASQGTYGMGISVFQSRDEVLAMNRRARNKMDVGKNNLKFTSVLVQEGVETVVKVENAPAEITVYLVDGKGMGGFMRYNPERGTNANLNSQGMLYRKFCISDICQDTDTHIKEAAYTVVARLSVLAASKEIQEINGEQA